MTQQEKIHFKGLVRLAAERLAVGDHASYQSHKRQAVVVYGYVDGKKFDRLVKKQQRN